MTLQNKTALVTGASRGIGPRDGDSVGGGGRARTGALRSFRKRSGIRRRRDSIGGRTSNCNGG
jgi:hypothetical protein